LKRGSPLRGYLGLVFKTYFGLFLGVLVAKRHLKALDYTPSDFDYTNLHVKTCHIKSTAKEMELSGGIYARA